MFSTREWLRVHELDLQTLAANPGLEVSFGTNQDDPIHPTRNSFPLKQPTCQCMCEGSAIASVSGLDESGLHSPRTESN